jgi:hypothetical protein
MNRCLTLLLLLGCAAVAKSQSRATELIKIQLSPINYKSKLPFNSITIIDSRYDTSKLGYIQKGSSFKRLVVTPSVSSGLSDVLNDGLRANFDVSANGLLIVVVKNLWLRETVNKTDLKPKSECISKLELYLKKDSSYFPLLRIDSVYTQNDLLKNCYSTLLATSIEKTLLRLESLNLEMVASSKKLRWEDIENFNRQRFNKPILSSPPQKGIYLTFKDFLQNKVDPREFEVVTGTLTDQLYVKDKNDKSVLTEFWSVCDGEKIYVNGGFKFFELKKVDNGFEFWANTNFIKYKAKSRNIFPMFGPSGIALLPAVANYAVDELSSPRSPDFERPFQVNMETGETY